jgi:signal transduction histidine kinase
MGIQPASRSALQRALLITGAYAMVAGAYIAWSSAYIGTIAEDPSRLAEMEVRKGLAFVAITSTGLFIALYSLFKRHGRLREQLLQRSTALARAQGHNNLQVAVTAIAHDMKNLLMALDLSQRELQAQRRHEGDGESEALGDAMGAVQRLREMALELMRRGQRTDEAAQVEVVALSQTVLQTVRMVRLFAPQHRCVIDVDTDAACLVRADPHSLEHIFLNLILNAIDATSREGHIEIDVRAGDPVVVAVTDDGPGVPAHLRDRIFEPFFTTKGPEGTGLGLAVVKEVTQRLGGSVTVRDARPSGTVFEVRLPAATVEPGGASEGPSHGQAS